MSKIALVIGCALVLQGCTYAISPDMVRNADKTVTFEMILADPDAFKGKLVILGGTIARTKSMKQGTLIEVVQKDLDYWGKPKRTDKTGGKFLLLSRGYLDPMVYAPGREITAAAEVTGTEQKSLGEVEYDYPVLIPKELKLWARERQYGSQINWYDPLYDPYGPARQSW